MFNLLDILTNLIKDAKQRNTNKKIKIDLDIPDKKLFVYGDKSRLDQVISNLLSNAFASMAFFKFTLLKSTKSLVSTYLYQ